MKIQKKSEIGVLLSKEEIMNILRNHVKLELHSRNEIDLDANHNIKTHELVEEYISLDQYFIRLNER